MNFIQNKLYYIENENVAGIFKYKGDGKHMNKDVLLFEAKTFFQLSDKMDSPDQAILSPIRKWSLEILEQCKIFTKEENPEYFL